MDIHVGDIITMKKSHPCGSKEWKVMRVGMDFRVICLGCGREMENKRSAIEKSIKIVTRAGRVVSKEELSVTRTEKWAEMGKE
ncbi:MAG: DUF951 domain-containing protein [Oscillospiraceae bacterium]|nr:DUF951 domain-containing protein [Oscillospiraceae bacterium]